MQVPGQDGRDPLGRPLNQRNNFGGLTPDGRRQNIEGTLGAERALRIQQELRQRLRDEGRSPIEIEYLLRLLRRF